MGRGMNLIIDTREQKPLTFDFPTTRSTLHTGDYSIGGYEQVFCVERKSIADLIGTCDFKNRKRFKRELQRMQDGYEFYCIVIDGKESDILPHCQKVYKKQYGTYLAKKKRGIKCRPPMRPEVREKSVMGSLLSWRSGFNCHHYFTGSREKSAELILDMAERFVYNKEKQDK
jgi:ERCC4-type nuclease